MKRITTYTLSFLVLLILVLAACRKDSSIITDTPIYPVPTILVETGARGLVSDETGKPIEGAIVRLGQETTTTNSFGYYEIIGKTNATQPFVRIEKSGFFPSICNFTGRPGEFGRLKSILRTKTLSGQVHSSQGGEIQVTGGGKVQFQSDGFVNAAGQPYHGAVHVYATYLDPTKPETVQMIPGSFRGTNIEGEDQVLVSYGMMHVLLESPSGEKLQINKPATLTTPIPAQRLGDAPPSIPLWYIDEATSLWKEEGSATKQGNMYVGEVSHFSWWNCDIGIPTVNITGRILVGDNFPCVFIRITTQGGMIGVNAADYEGFFKGGVPANETMLFEVLNECDNVVYSQSLGPYSADYDLGNIDVNVGSVWTNIHGSLVDCNSDPVVNGVVFVQNANLPLNQFPIHVNPATGSFSGTYPTCSGEIILTGYDSNNLIFSDEIVSPFADEIDFGIIPVCNGVVSIGLTIEYEGNIKRIEEISVQKIDTSSTYSRSYLFKTSESQPSGIVEYTIWLHDRSGNPANPDWIINTSVSYLDGCEYFAGFHTGQKSVLQAGLMPGQFVHVQIKNATLMKFPDQKNISNVKVNILAELQ